LHIATICPLGHEPIETTSRIQMLEAIQVIITHLINDHAHYNFWLLNGLRMKLSQTQKENNEEAYFFHTSKIHIPFC
jgi:hypothetical protein